MSNIELVEVEDLKESLREIVREVITGTIPSSPKSDKSWLNRHDVKRILGVSDAQLQYLRDSRQIPFSQFGRKIVYKAEDVEAFLNRHRVEAHKRVLD